MHLHVSSVWTFWYVQKRSNSHSLYHYNINDGESSWVLSNGLIMFGWSLGVGPCPYSGYGHRSVDQSCLDPLGHQNGARKVWTARLNNVSKMQGWMKYIGMIIQTISLLHYLYKAPWRIRMQMSAIHLSESLFYHILPIFFNHSTSNTCNRSTCADCAGNSKILKNKTK